MKLPARLNVQAGFAVLRDQSGKLMLPRRQPDRKDVIANDRVPFSTKFVF